MLNIENSYWW